MSSKYAALPKLSETIDESTDDQNSLKGNLIWEQSLLESGSKSTCFLLPQKGWTGEWEREWGQESKTKSTLPWPLYAQHCPNSPYSRAVPPPQQLLTFHLSIFHVAILAKCLELILYPHPFPHSLIHSKSRCPDILHPKEVSCLSLNVQPWLHITIQADCLLPELM